MVVDKESSCIENTPDLNVKTGLINLNIGARKVRSMSA